MSNLVDRTKLFREFPLSVRIAQRSWLTALAIPILSLRILTKIKVPWVVQTILGIAGLCGVVGFVATCWVVVRYPFIGMVDAADGDLYANYVEKTSMILKKFVGLCTAIGLGISLYLPLADGRITGIEILWMIYASLVLVFVLFLLLRYNRFDHPTVATLLRSSMGLGILFFPLFLPAVIVGSGRAKRLLGEAQERLTN
jgi:hypothetical protein